MPIEDDELIIVGEVEVEAVIGLEDDPEIIEEIDLVIDLMVAINLVVAIDLVIEEEKNPEIEEDIEEEA